VNSGKIHPADRRDQILMLVKARGSIQVSETARTMGVAPITVRRDIADLARQGKVEQVHGGARRVDSSSVSLRAGATTVGVVTPSLDFYWPAIIDGANQAADAVGARLVLQGSTFAARDNLEQIKALVSESEVQGLLLVPDLEGPHAEELIDYLQTLDLPVVLVERSLSPRGRRTRVFESVTTNHVGGADLAVRHLANLGHRRIALLTDKRIPQRLRIEEGWRAALVDLGLDTGSPHADTTLLTDAARAQAIDGFVGKCVESGVTAMLVHSDEAALGVLEQLRSRGVDVPGRMSVVTYDDELATLARPALTAIAPPKREIGVYAMETLTNRLVHPDRALIHVSLEPALVVRDSTGAPPDLSDSSAG
jgi:DNA-binding LacI/PurR family transcriptional regulator